MKKKKDNKNINTKIVLSKDKTKETTIKSNSEISKNQSNRKKQKEIRYSSFEQINKNYFVKKDSREFDEINILLERIDKYIFNDLYLNTDSVFLLAVSGGVDSIVMLDIFVQLTFKYPLMKLSVAHFNHKLRKETAQRDQKFVEDTCKKYNIPFFTGEEDVKKYAELKGIGIEYAARILRYRFLERVAQKVEAQYLATAHTADDSAETFFINLFRGAGLTGLSGIASKRNLSRKLSLVRPLINIRKDELIHYAKVRGLSWKEDETNQLMNFTRNKIRLDIIPKIEEHFSPSVINTINRAQKLLQGADSIIAKQIQKIIPGLIKEKSNGRFSIKLSVISLLDSFLQGEIIQRVLSNNFNLQNVPMLTIDRIIELQNKPVGSVCEINKNFIVLRDRDTLIFSRAESKNEIFLPISKEGTFAVENKKITLGKVSKRQIKFTDNPNIEYLDWDLVPSVLYIRSWKQGDTFSPLGMNGSMKVSDFLTNNKIPLIDKGSILLLTTKSDVIWICGLRISDKYKITEETTKYLKVEYVLE
jgi:tRNA(Ile)-lysidine synthase